MSRHRCQPTKIFKFPKKVLDIFCVPCYYIEALKRAAQNAPVAQLDRVTDYESVGQGFESLPAYQKSGYPIRDNRFFNTRVDSKARPRRSRGEKHAGGMFFRAWESPWDFRCIRQGCS